MDSSPGSKSSSPASDPLDLEAGIATTPADVAVLRRLREATVPGLLERLNELNAPALFPHPARRATHAGFEPFEL
jgi:hypothetical protein